MPLTPEQRQAQRRFVSTLRNYCAITESGLEFWWPNNPEYEGWAHDLSDVMETLEIPHERLVAPRPAYRSKKLSRYGLMLRVAPADFPAVLRWAPSFQKHLDSWEQKRANV